MEYKIAQHRLKKGKSSVEFIETRYKDGSFGATPKILVMHFTYGASGRSSANWFRDPNNPGSSAHVVVDRDGTVIQCADFTSVCWHAGRSRLREISGLNHYSLGIEMANWGYLRWTGSNWTSHTGADVSEVVVANHRNGNPENTLSPCGWEAYADVQFKNAVAIARALVDTYHINEIVGHDDISKGRKWDPGPAFDMARFRALVFGERGDNSDNRMRVTPEDGLNLRGGPGTHFNTIEKLNKGQEVQPLQREGLWLSVSVIGDNGQPRATGWMHSEYLEEV